jgi:hypothetical protein
VSTQTILHSMLDNSQVALFRDDGMLLRWFHVLTAQQSPVTT